MAQQEQITSIEYYTPGMHITVKDGQAVFQKIDYSLCEDMLPAPISKTVSQQKQAELHKIAFQLQLHTVQNAEQDGMLLAPSAFVRVFTTRCNICVHLKTPQLHTLVQPLVDALKKL